MDRRPPDPESDRHLMIGVSTLHRFLRAAVDDPRFGRLVSVGARAVEAVDMPAVLRRPLRGERFGHAVHPMLTDFTNGPWMGASFLDLFGPAGCETAARRLVGLGLIASVPTALSGLMDWRDARGGAARVGVVHAATSSLATVMYGWSYVARRRGNHRQGVLAGLLGGVVAFVDGYVGGELSLVARVGTGRRAGR